MSPVGPPSHVSPGPGRRTFRASRAGNVEGGAPAPTGMVGMGRAREGPWRSGAGASHRYRTRSVNKRHARPNGACLFGVFLCERCEGARMLLRRQGDTPGCQNLCRVRGHEFGVPALRFWEQLFPRAPRLRRCWRPFHNCGTTVPNRGHGELFCWSPRSGRHNTHTRAQPLPPPAGGGGGGRRAAHTGPPPEDPEAEPSETEPCAP